MIPGIEPDPVLHPVVRVRRVRHHANSQKAEIDRLPKIETVVDFRVAGWSVGPLVVVGRVVDDGEAVGGLQRDAHVSRQHRPFRIALDEDLAIRLGAKTSQSTRKFGHRIIVPAEQIADARVHGPAFARREQVSEPAAIVTVDRRRLGERCQRGLIIGQPDGRRGGAGQEAVRRILLVVIPTAQHRELEPRKLPVAAQPVLVPLAPQVDKDRQRRAERAVVVRFQRGSE